MIAESVTKSRVQTLNELKYRTLVFILTSTVLLAQCWLILDNMILKLPNPNIALPCLLLQGICAASYVISRRHFLLAVYIFALGFIVCNTWAMLTFQNVAFLYLLLIMGLIVGPLVSQVHATAITSIASGAVLLCAVLVPSVPWLLLQLLLWYALLISIAVSLNFSEALNIAWSYQNYAVRQMNDAREHRGQLMQLAKLLHEAREDLQHANVQLRHARRAAEDAQCLKAQFAANVSHEFRTPINLIVGFSEIILAGSQAYATPLPSAYWTDMNTLYQSARHLQALINDILDVAQLEAGQMIVFKEEVDPRQVIIEAAELVHELVTSKGLDYQIDIPDNLPLMSLDRIRIRQVLLNLLSNAVRFTDEGHVHISAALRGDWLHIHVTDTGIGIAPQDVEHVFEEFRQLETAAARRTGGTGLGLTLSKRFVELHGGEIGVQSEGILGKGSTFWIKLPVVASPRSWRIDAPTMAVKEPDARYFLVLEDDPAVSQLFEQQLQHHRAIVVHSYADALRLTETIHPTAVVIDAVRGADFQSPNDTPVIRCSMPSGKRAMQQYGIADYLVKPVSSKDLRQSLERLAIPIQTILIIDDDVEIVRLYSRMLHAMSPSYDIWEAYSGNEGLALMRHQPPDVVLLDLLMPEVDGFRVIEHMQSDPRLAGIPVVMTSAHGAVDAIAPVPNGEITVVRKQGFRPIEMIRCIEAIVDNLIPTSAT
jgi:signal transduction histidine kinase/CheY-like chemotaxis protein